MKWSSNTQPGSSTRLPPSQSVSSKSSKCGASPRKPHNVGETIFFFLAALNSPDSMLQIDIQFANYLPPPPKKEMMESLKFSFPSVFFLLLGLLMISDFIRVTWWRTTNNTTVRCFLCEPYFPPLILPFIYFFIINDDDDVVIFFLYFVLVIDVLICLFIVIHENQ